VLGREVGEKKKSLGKKAEKKKWNKAVGPNSEEHRERKKKNGGVWGRTGDVTQLGGGKKGPIFQANLEKKSMKREKPQVQCTRKTGKKI